MFSYDGEKFIESFCKFFAILMSIIMAISCVVFISMPIIFSVNSFKMLSEGIYSNFLFICSGYGIIVILSAILCPLAIVLSAIDKFGPAPWFERKGKNIERYDAIEAKHKKVSKIAWFVYLGVMVLNIAPILIGIWATFSNSFALASICFGVIGIVCAIEIILAIIGLIRTECY